MIDPEIALGDPINLPFWEGAEQRQLRVQRCVSCGASQFYGRPFCLRCESDAVAWTPAKGTGTVVSMTTVRMQVDPRFTPPYVVAIVELDEGPRLLTQIAGQAVIGERVRVNWMERRDGPPLPIFESDERKDLL